MHDQDDRAELGALGDAFLEYRAACERSQALADQRRWSGALGGYEDQLAQVSFAVLDRALLHYERSDVLIDDDVVTLRTAMRAATHSFRALAASVDAKCNDYRRIHRRVTLVRARRPVVRRVVVSRRRRAPRARRARSRSPGRPARPSRSSRRAGKPAELGGART